VYVGSELRLVYRNGFVHSVRVPTIASVLTQQLRPGDSGLSVIMGTATYTWEPTPYAIDLFAKWGTVREVVLADRLPSQNGDAFYWIDQRYYNNSGVPPVNATLPSVIFDAFPDSMRHVNEMDLVPFAGDYPTPEAAVAALGQALADVLRVKCHSAT
jgi:hypothetical protein